MNVKTISDFWRGVKPSETGCWLYDGAPTGTGTGSGHVQFQFNNKQYYAHRLMYELVHGPIPDGVDVCHHCDVPNCVSPWHLFPGTHADNMLDSARKGRKNKKLTIPQAREIKQLIASGHGDKTIAAAFGVCRQTINDMRHGRYRTYL